MSETRWPRTVADDPTLMRALHVHDDAAFDPTLSTTMIVAPCCGRHTPADTVVDVSGIGATIVAGGGHRAPKDHDYLCDGCLHRLEADPKNDWTFSKLYSALGAPPEVVRHQHARELANHHANRDFAAGREHRPTEALILALQTLPPGIDPHRRSQ